MCTNQNNDAKKALKYQKQQAAQAAKEEAARKARLEAGSKTINELFDGAPVMGERDATYDWSQFTTKATGGAGAGVTTAKVNPSVSMNKGGRDGNFPGNGQNSSYSKNQSVGGKGGGSKFTGTVPEGYTAKQVNGQWVLVGADGKTYKKGDALTYKQKYDTGQKTGGFGQDFYDKYRTAATDYYMPELDRQYKLATDNLTYDHARAGTLTSSMSGQNLADLVYQNDMNKSQIFSKVDSAVGDLKQSVATQKAAAIGQLYATEDPGIAANTATNSVANLRNTTPEYSALGEMFKNAVVGASGYANGYQNYQNWGSGPGGGSSGKTVI